MNRAFTAIMTITFLFIILTNPIFIINNMNTLTLSSDKIEPLSLSEGGTIDDQLTGAPSQETGDISTGMAADYTIGQRNRVVDYETRNDLINITSNQNFTDTASLPANNWPGTGTKYDPIIIENYNITRTDRPNILINLEDITLHFIIRNCYLRGATQVLMKFVNASNGIIEGNHFGADSTMYETGVNLDSNSGYNIIKYNIFEVFEYPMEGGINAHNDNISNSFIYNYWDDNWDNFGNDIDLDGIYDDPYAFINGSARLPDFSSRVYKENWNHLPIEVNSEAELELFMADEGWPGNGTAINPYTLEGLNFTLLGRSTLKGIILENSDLHVKIDTCFFNMTGSNTVIETDMVTNLYLLNNTVVEGPYGCWLQNSNDTSIINNTFIDCRNGGVTFTNTVNTNIINNTFLYCWFGIHITNSDQAWVYNNTVKFSDQTGVYYFNSDFISTENLTVTSTFGWGMYLNQARNCTFVNSSITDNEQDGITAENGADQSFISCNISSNGVHGVESNCDNVTYDKSVFNNNTIGVYLRWADNCSITNSEVTNNRDDGIQANNTESLTVNNVNSSWNAENGLLLRYNLYTNITSSFFNDNGLSGIYLLGSSINEVSECDIMDNGNHGLELVSIEAPDSYEANSSYNLFDHNTIENNTDHGIYCTSPSNTTVSEGYDMTISYNTFSFNTVQGNTLQGIYFNASIDNFVFNNSFIDNGGLPQGYDNDLSISNNFTYNHWSDWLGLDDDENGIGDTPYALLGGSNSDDYPVVYGWQLISTTNVNVTITYPNGGESLNKTITVIWTVNDTSSAWTYAVEYSSDGGSEWTELDTVTTDNGTVEFDWNTTQMVDGIEYTLRVTITDDNTIGSDESDGLFSIDNSGISVEVTIIYPNGGETLNQTVTASWTVNDTSSAWTYSVEYSSDGGSEWTELDTVTTDNGTVEFGFNTSQLDDGAGYSLKVSITDEDVAGSDETDGFFTIDNSGSSGQTQPEAVDVDIINPADGDTLVGTVNISWTATTPPGEISYEISYSKDAGETWNVLDTFSSAAITVNYSWDTTGYLDGLRYRIRVNITTTGVVGLDTTGTFEIDNDDDYDDQIDEETTFEITDTVAVTIDVTGLVNVSIDEVSIEDVPIDPSLNMAGIFLNITLSDPSALTKLWINITFAELGDLDPAGFKIFYYDETLESWEEVTSTGVDIVNGVVWGWIDHLTLFGVMERKATAPTDWGPVIILAVLLIGAAVIAALLIYIQARKKQLQKEGQEKSAADIVRELADGFMTKITKSDQE